MTYAISDIHGEYGLFQEILSQISLKEEDTLFVLGDILDRGPSPLKVLFQLMMLPQAVCLVGNHELMAIQCLDFLQKEITEENIESLNPFLAERLLTWQFNGCHTTLEEFRRLSPERRQDVIDFLLDLSVCAKISAADQDYILVHAGLGNFSPTRDLEDYSLEELVWERPDYDKDYFSDCYTITGHTPTQVIEGNPHPGSIYRKGHHIAIDCGACFPGGRLGALCLETGEEFYSSWKS